MVDPVFKFHSYLIEKNLNGQYTFPLQGLVLTKEECSQICGIVRSKLFVLFNDMCKYKESEYKIYLQDKKQLDVLKPFKDEIDITTDTLYLAISSNELQEAFKDLEDRKRKKVKKETEQEKKEKEVEIRSYEKAILIELGKDLKLEIIFRSVIGDLQKILNLNQLQIPQAYNFSPDELSELKILKRSFNIMQKNHYIANESGNHIFVSDILRIALNFVKPEQVKIQSEYTIAPMLEFEKYTSGIERRVDCALFKELLSDIICLTEVKTSLMDLQKCLMKNADQMRAFCLCNGKKKVAGFATNGIKWIFTYYKVMDIGQRDQFLVSKPVDVLQEKVFGYYEMMESNYVGFFGSLISFIMENMNSI